MFIVVYCIVLYECILFVFIFVSRENGIFNNYVCFPLTFYRFIFFLEYFCSGLLFDVYAYISVN